MSELEPTRTYSDLTATDYLRAMLTERGVEWNSATSPIGSIWTYWDAFNGHRVYARDNENGTVKIFGEWDVTPEQAIEATLGRGECHAIISDNLTESEGAGDAWADCSECGHLLFVLTDPSSKPPKFCPNCGRRIKED